MLQLDHGRNSPQAKRMRQLRALISGNNASLFADAIGVTPQRWKNAETGIGVSKDLEDILCKRISGMSADWIRHGDPSGLPVELAFALAQQ